MNWLYWPWRVGHSKRYQASLVAVHLSVYVCMLLSKLPQCYPVKSGDVLNLQQKEEYCFGEIKLEEKPWQQPACL
jgi:hypothetical protein